MIPIDHQRTAGCRAGQRQWSQSADWPRPSSARSLSAFASAGARNFGLSNGSLCVSSCVAELSCISGSRRRLRRRWPGVSAGLCLGRPARRTPGLTRRGTQIKVAHTSHSTGRLRWPSFSRLSGRVVPVLARLPVVASLNLSGFAAYNGGPIQQPVLITTAVAPRKGSKSGNTAKASRRCLLQLADRA